jgi:hypothetical protein
MKAGRGEERQENLWPREKVSVCLVSKAMSLALVALLDWLRYLLKLMLLWMRVGLSRLQSPP